MRVVALDATDRLTPFWRLGSLVSGADLVVRAASWEDVYDALAPLAGVRDLQIWGHGFSGAPVIDGRRVDLLELGRAWHPAAGAVVWFRSCEVAKGVTGQTFMRDAARVLGCSVVGHCAVISSPNPLWQREIAGLRPGQEPWWPPDGAGLRGCSTLRMSVPDHAWRPT